MKANMNISLHQLTLCAALALLCATLAHAGPLSKAAIRGNQANKLGANGAFSGNRLAAAVDMAVRGKWADEDTQSVTLNGHGFYIRPVGAKTDLTRAGETGYFRHRHRGKDDRVFYKIKVSNGRVEVAEITRIEYRGPFNQGGMIELGVGVVGVSEGGADGALVAQKLWERIKGAFKDGNFARITDGDWEKEAAKIVDAIATRMAKDAK